jgi:hypothetical protein
MIVPRLLVCGAFILLTACGASTKQLKSRAASDFGCPASDLSLQKIDRRTYQVSGCNQRGTYISSCNYENQTGCTWILNSGIGDEATAPPQQREVAEAEAITSREDARIETGRAKDGSTQLKLYMRADRWMLYVGATPRTDGQLASIVWRVPKAYAAEECEIKLVADGARIELGGETTRSERDQAFDYKTTLPYGSLLAMAKGTRVAGRLCSVEATLSETQLAKLRELVVRIREEQAWDEEPARTENEAEVAPTEL